MNGFTENRAPGASERPGRDEQVFTWGAGQAMLPLVARIAADIVGHHERLALLQPEQARLERSRYTLAWPDRSRRYHLHEEITAVEGELRSACAELERLGLTLLDGAAGLVGFPTIVNDRKAYFSWRPGEDGLRFWNYAGDGVRRSVPAAWTQPPRERAPQSKSRRGKK
jgi:hypothetical protein